VSVAPGVVGITGVAGAAFGLAGAVVLGAVCVASWAMASGAKAVEPMRAAVAIRVRVFFISYLPFIVI